MPDVFVAGKSERVKGQEGGSIKDTGAAGGEHENIGSKTSEPKETSKTRHHRGRRRRHYHPFRAYMYRPSNMRFESQQDGEEILLLLRRHIITNIPWMLLALFLILAPLALPVFPIIAFLPANFQFIAVVFWYLVTFAFILESFLIWFFNVSIITNKRIIDIDFINLLYKEVADAEIEKIEDVTYKVGGAVRTVFNYGDVLVQTASEVPNFDFSAIPRPDDVCKLLQELREIDG